MALLKYLAVGTANTLTTLAVVFCLMWLGTEVLLANFLGYVIGVSLSYSLNRVWTFRSHAPMNETLPKFLVVAGAAYVANFVMVWLAHYLLSIDGYLAQAIGLPAYVVVGFLGSRYFAFRSASAE